MLKLDCNFAEQLYFGKLCHRFLAFLGDGVIIASRSKSNLTHRCIRVSRISFQSLAAYSNAKSHVSTLTLVHTRRNRKLTAAMREVSKKRQTPKGANLKTQQIGMLGVHLVAAEFIRRGFIVTDAQCGKAWTIQVKTTGKRTANWFNVGKHANDISSKYHVYVFVNFEDDQPKFLVVDSRIVKANARQIGEFVVFDRDKAGKKQWRIFSNTNRMELPYKKRGSS